MRRGGGEEGEGQKSDDAEGVEDDVGSAAVDGKTQAIPKAVSQLSHHVQLPRRLIYLPPSAFSSSSVQLGLDIYPPSHIMMLMVHTAVVDYARNYSTTFSVHVYIESVVRIALNLASAVRGAS